MEYQTNLLVALRNILERNSSILTPLFRSNGSANVAGDSLEYFVKDMFCTGASQYQMENEKMKIYNQYLSWTGDSKHFPDFIIKNGAGVEPKKVNGKSKGNIALNSSYPKDYIYPDSQNIPNNTLLMENEDWDKKDIIYAVGNLDNTNNKLLSLWLVNGNTFIANRKVYENLIAEIREAISKTNATLQDSKELARAIGIDPLNHANLRVRGMYELKHPEAIYGTYISDIVLPKESTRIYVVMLKDDLIKLELENEDLNEDLCTYYNQKRLFRKDICIPNPNNISSTLEAVIFCAYTD